VTPLGWLLRRRTSTSCATSQRAARRHEPHRPAPERPEFVQELDQVIPATTPAMPCCPGSPASPRCSFRPTPDVESVRKKLLYDLHYVRHARPLARPAHPVCTALHVVGVPGSHAAALGLVPDRSTSSSRATSRRPGARLRSKQPELKNRPLTLAARHAMRHHHAFPPLRRRPRPALHPAQRVRGGLVRRGAVSLRHHRVPC